MLLYLLRLGQAWRSIGTQLEIRIDGFRYAIHDPSSKGINQQGRERAKEIGSYLNDLGIHINQLIQQTDHEKKEEK